MTGAGTGWGEAEGTTKNNRRQFVALDTARGVPCWPALRQSGQVSTSTGAGRGRSEGAPALDVVLDVEQHLRAIAFPLDLDGAAQARALQRRVLAQISSHLVPRLRQGDLPAVVVVGGPTGAGKSTLVNTLAGEQVTEAGVLRPTTRRPVLVVHPSDAEAMSHHPVLARAELATAAGLPRGIALLDAPDLDSVDSENRNLAVELVETADLWLFVTTANRYGDALPWEILDVVRERGVTIGVVLDRVPESALDEVRRDLHQRLATAGFETIPLFVVPDAGPHEGPLEAELVSEIAQWLSLLGTRAASREVVARTLRGVWGPLRSEVRQLLDAALAQIAAAEELARIAHDPVDRLADELAIKLRNGVLADGGPTTRWLAAAGSGGPLEPLAHDVTGWWARRRTQRLADARVAAVTGLLEEVGSSFRDVVGRSAAESELAVREAWQDRSSAGAALAASRSRQDAAADRTRRVDAAWTGWLSTVAAREAAATQPTEPILDAEGRAAVLALAVAGIDGAATATKRWWTSADELRADSLSDLVSVAHDVLAGEVQAFIEAVTAQLSPDAAIALRLRVSELRALSGEQE